MGYELFDSKTVRLGTPGLTLTADGRMWLNADAADLLRREGGKFVHILWDSAACKMALKPLTVTDGRSFTLTSKRGRRGMMISASSFLRYIQWNSRKSTTVETIWNKKDKLLEATLPSKFIGS